MRFALSKCSTIKQPPAPAGYFLQYWSSCILRFLVYFVAVTNTLTESSMGEKRVRLAYSSKLQTFTVGKSRQGPEVASHICGQEQREMDACPPPPLLQSPRPKSRHSTTINRLGFPTSTSTVKTMPHRCVQPDPANPSLRLSSR